MYVAGIDIGSITSKAAILKDGAVMGTRVIFTGYNAERAGRMVYDELLGELGLDASAVEKIVSTGYGRNSVSFADKAMTEIICHGAGAHYLYPHVRSIIDVGGQDSKAMVLDEQGRVRDFAMNDKCAAGTGRFLEVMARALEVDLDAFGDISLKAKRASQISSICTVFAESEVISLISKGENRENIIAGIHESVAARISALARRVGVREPLMMTGGVAKNRGAVKALEKKLEMAIEVSPYAQTNGAIGAAVMAMRL
ncbi:MAG: 2-hydroxyglutaryl-CoA dehydratase [Deltaproteobacteria bacterium]|nr:2-hydroxyglutaryl-CoA dehydratase [Deltaproteobacteria bacterium]